jgi:hypothetical protein
MTTKPGESAAAEPVSAAQGEFDKAWDEFDADDAANEAAIAAEDALTAENEEPGPESDDDLDPPADGSADEPSADKADGRAQDQPDIWAGVSPELIAERDRLRAAAASPDALVHRKRSDDGRIAALQRQVTAAHSELAAIKAAKPAVSEEDAEALRAAQEEYPEVVKPLLSRMDRQQARLEEIEQSERSRQAQAAADREAIEAAETEKVNAALPNFLDMISFEDAEGSRSPTPEFVSWYRRQSPEVQAKVNRNADSITDAASAIEVLSAYKDFQAHIDAAAAAAAEDRTPQTSSRRQRQIESSRAVVRGSQQTGLTAAVPNDWDGAWDFYDRQDAAKASRAR